MKKILLLCVAITIITPLAILTFRHFKNDSSITPYPYIFKPQTYTPIETDASILIMGDTFAARLAGFKSSLATKISGDIKKTITIESLAEEGEGLHRTLEKLKNLKRLPLIIILMSNIDNHKELIFRPSESKDIYQNLKIYENPLIQSIVMIFPDLAKYFYNHVNYVELDDKIKLNQNISAGEEVLYQQHMQMYFKLYSATLNEFFTYTTKRNSIVIPITSPLHHKLKPKKSCYGSLAPDTKNNFQQTIELINQKDFKSAFNIAKDLVLINSSHAATHFIHGIINERLNNYRSAYHSFLNAKAYDCANTGVHPIFNEILKNKTSLFGLEYIDYDRFIYDQSLKNNVFLDETYPQDLFFQRLNDMLANKIKSLLKL